MNKKLIAIPIILVLSLLAASRGYCEECCVVVLKNGNTLTANSYNVEKGKLFLHYPAGNTAFNLSCVSLVRNTDGKVDLFQRKGNDAVLQEQPVDRLSLAADENRIEPRAAMTVHTPITNDFDELIDKFAMMYGKQREETEAMYSDNTAGNAAQSLPGDETPAQ